MNIYLMRHGQTQWNVENRLQGRKDSHLTEKGRQDAALLGECIHTMNLDAIYTSVSSRAIQTAQIVRGQTTIPLS